MTEPTQSMYVETQALYDCASTWRDSAAPDIKTAQTMAVHGEGQGYLFGVLLIDLQKPHDDFATAAATVLGTGQTVAGEMGAALETVAHHYETNDAEAATLMTKKEAGIK